MRYIEKLVRTYENNVIVEYEYIGKNIIHIRKIRSSFRQEGNGTKALQSFIDEFREYNLYLNASSEHGTDENVLHRWYEKLGFATCEEVINNLCMTHVLKAKVE